MVGGSIDFDTVLDLCADQDRRIVLGLLAEEQRPLTLRDLMTAVLEYGQQTRLEEASEGKMTPTKVSLYHRHLPKLEAVGVIEYDLERQRVWPTEQFDELQPTLSVILDADPNFTGPFEL